VPAMSYRDSESGKGLYLVTIANRAPKHLKQRKA
jgi:hypothetical protein